jgi:hypothetical protein
MTTRAGAEVRLTLYRDFDILHIWDLGDTRLFEAAVLPAVLLVKKKDCKRFTGITRFSSIYSTSSQSSTKVCSDVIAALAISGEVRVENNGFYIVRHGKLDFGNSPDDVWRITTDCTDQWLLTLQAKTYCTFGDIGKIRVGVKTTADKVFIRSDWASLPASEQPELLRPIITHHIARRFKSLKPIRQILYTHSVTDGKRTVIDLHKYPRAARYLNRHRSILEARKYVIESGRNWFEIWVPQDPGSWPKPKLVFRDITERPTFWIDLDGAIVNGDCYWLTCDNTDNENLLWLALAVGNSTFIEEFYDRQFNNKLYAGRRRFMTRYVERFPLPDPTSNISKKIIRTVKRLYSILPSSEGIYVEQELDRLIWQVFGLPPEERPR